MRYGHLVREILAVALLIAHCAALGQETPRHVVFVNGVWNTFEQAVGSANEIRDSLSTTATRAANNRRSFSVSLVYNPAGWGTSYFFQNLKGVNVWDILEVFLLKTAEECFRDDFRRISVPHDQTGAVDIDGGAAARVAAYLDDVLPPASDTQPCGDTVLGNSGFVKEQDLEGTRRAALGIVAQVRSTGAAIVIAHSQGNLLANLAYGSLAREFGNEVNRKVRIVNVANPSELSSHGLNFTHADDNVISTLPALPGAVEATPLVGGPALAGHRSTPVCNITSLCPFVIAAAPLSGASDGGHGLVDTYLSSSTVGIANAQGVTFTSGATRFVDRFVDFVYAAAVSLDAAGAISQPSSMHGGKIGGGDLHTCALTRVGGVKCWGFNKWGQIGDGTSGTVRQATAVRGLDSGVVAIAVGGSHSCALTGAGGLKCWGYNVSGQLGDGTTTNRLAPVDVTGLTSGVVAVAAGASHTCAVTSAGAVKCWGAGAWGRLGDGSEQDSASPVDVQGLPAGIRAVAAGWAHSCALTSVGEVLCWGLGGGGRLGNVPGLSSYTPVQVQGLDPGNVAVATGNAHSCAITGSGWMKCWGVNEYGQLGTGSKFSVQGAVDVQGLKGSVVSLVAGVSKSCALLSTGGAMCWGSNTTGALGDGSDAVERAAPVDVVGLGSAAVDIGGTGHHTCALTVESTVKCWGNNANGELGRTDVLYSNVPVDVVGF